MIVIVTGASGAGKTTLVRALEARTLPGVACHYFDSIGVPSTGQMIAEYGSGAAWQEAMTRRWIGRLQQNGASARIAVLDGQVDIAMAHRCLVDAGIESSRIILVDCAPDVREARLRELRGQPELADREMATWAAHLKGQAEAFGCPIIDTSSADIAACTDPLIRYIPPE